MRQVTTRITLTFDACLTPGTYYTYQQYYIHGLKATEGIDFRISPVTSQILADLRDAKSAGAQWIWNKHVKLNAKHRYLESNHVGRYNVSFGPHHLRLAIDIADTRNIRDMNSLNWCDIYFKANKWPSLEYPKKVYPIVNGNGKLDPEKIRIIKAHRSTEKTLDLVYLSKLWSRPDSFENVLEHQVRIFEMLAKLDCTKRLLAVVPANSKQQLKEYLHRLDSAGVEWTEGWGSITSTHFWNTLAAAKVVFQRSGNHHCISWRMTDLLCMGACIVMDKAPHPQWPVPLEHGKHFVDCRCGFEPDFSIPDKQQYNSIRKNIECLLNDDQAQDRYRQNCRTYFDANASPQKVAAYLLRTIKAHADTSANINDIPRSTSG